jgi:parallel beta-helix repeat protein
MLVSLLLISMFTLASDVQPVKSESTATIWQIGKFLGGTSPNKGSQEFEHGTAFFGVYDYYVDTNPDNEINAPNCPGFLWWKAGGGRWTAMAINIHFNLDYLYNDVVLKYGRYGSEHNMVYLDCIPKAFIVGPGEGVYKLSHIRLGTLAPGAHIITIRYEGGGIDEGHHIDALRLSGNPSIPPPKIEEIIITGIPGGPNPMTECPSTYLTETVRFEAKITPAEDFEVTKVSWSGDVKPGEGNPYETWYDPGTHGKKKVACTIAYKHKVTGETGTDTSTKEFLLFFWKTGDDDFDFIDNWYHYWSSSDDAACSFDRTSVTYTYGGGSYAGNNFARYNGDPNNPVYTIYNRAAMAESYNAAGLNIDRKGIDCVEASLEHEIEHQRTDAKWQPGGEWHNLYGPRTTGAGGNDRDGDELPNQWEVDNAALGFDPDNATSFPGFPYGDDEEVWCEMVAQNRKGVAANDWANLGKQTDPEYKRIATENGTAATLSGTYVDYGIDTDANWLYDYLLIEIEVNVVAAGTYRIFGNLYDQKENMLWAENHTHLDIGTQLVILNFDGLKIHQCRVDGPYQLRYLTLFGKNFTDEMSTPYNTSPYEYIEFDGPVMEFTGVFSDYGTDTDDDGSYNYLTIETEANINKSGTYTIIGYLYDSKGTDITSTAESAYFDVGRQLVILNFDGLSINWNRADGPYHLRYLSLKGNDQFDFIQDAYITSAYSYTDFQKTDSGFTGSFSDYGKDLDEDGQYNYLTLEVGIDAIISGNYALVGLLYDNTGAEIAMASNSVYLDAGSQTIPLDFDGFSIYNHGVDGPYDLKYLTLHDENGTLMDTLDHAYTTSTYNFTDFQSVHPFPPVTIKADGSIDPPAAPISTIDNITYTFTDNINNTKIDVKRSNIIVDGKGHTLDGTGYSWVGIELCTVDNVTIKNINLKNFDYGVYCGSGSENVIAGNTIINNTYGVSILSSRNTLLENNITDNSVGIMLYSSNNTLSSDIIKNNYYGIYLYHASNNTLFDNSITNNSNSGIHLSYSSNNAISNNTVTNNYNGIHLGNASCNTLFGNIVADNGKNGILLEAGSNYNTLSINNITNSYWGCIWLEESSNNGIIGNNITNNDCGIGLYGGSSNNNVSGNNITANDYSIDLYYSSNYNIISGNNINNYWGCIWLEESSNNGIIGNNITNSYEGLVLFWSSNSNTILRNNITANDYGIELGDSSNNTISGCTITDNKEYGILLESSSNNFIYHNSFVDNTEQVYSYDSKNVWDDGYPSGGNYWSDYTDTDLYSGPYQNETGSDGIWDHPYVIDADNTDNYPLAKHYIARIWSIETVDDPAHPDSSFTGKGASLALDSNDNPHISYLGDGNYKYARWNGSTWNIQTVDSTGYVGGWTSIALDSQDNPHISYGEKYARWNGSTWLTETVDSTGVSVFWTSIALDSNNNPHISYHDYTNESLKYARWNGSAWNIQTVDDSSSPDCSAGRGASLALDSNDNPHISYQYNCLEIVPEPHDYRLKYARWNGSAWNIQTVDAVWIGSYTSLALDSNDNPHISYCDDYHPYLKYRRWNGSTWLTETEIVDSTDHASMFMSLALDSSDNPHISYYKYGYEGALKYARWTGSKWSIENVDSTGDVGQYTSLALDSNDNPHISYYDDTNYDLKYATLKIHDVAVTDVAPSKTTVGEGYSISIDVTVENQGTCTENFDVTIYANAISIASLTVTITSGNSKTITFTWDPTGVAIGNHTIKAVADTVPGETDTADNTYVNGWVVVTIPGDSNGDYKVNHKDLLLLASAYGSEVGDPKYIPEADLDCTGKVDHKDLLILAANYGKET